MEEKNNCIVWKCVFISLDFPPYFRDDFAFINQEILKGIQKIVGNRSECSWEEFSGRKSFLWCRSVFFIALDFPFVF